MNLLSHFLSRRAHTGRLIFGSLAAFLLLLFVSLSPTPSAFAATHAPASPHQALCVRGACIVQTTTSSNTHGNYTIINSEYPNNSSNAVVIVSPVLDLSNPLNAFTFDSAPIGVEYNNQLQRWLIVNEDGSPMPIGARFNIEAFGAAPDEGTFSIPTDSVDLIDNSRQVVLDNALSNMNSHALILVTDQINQANPNHDTHTVGTSYDSTTGKWVLFHTDGTPMNAGEIYNLLILASQQTYTQTVSVNTDGLLACVNATGYNDPTATPVATIRGTATFTDQIGLLYDPLNSEWCVFDTSIAPLPASAQFSISNV
jgi:hypothetical protein